VTAERIEIETSRGRFAAYAAGKPEDPLALCLHGFPDNASTFDGLLGQLAAGGFRAVAPYCRGYAPSPLLNPDGSRFGKDLFDVLARDVLAIADALRPDAQIRVVGHDNGAFTVYHALALAPDRFARAVALTAGHPAAVFRNTGRSPRQIWRSRYAFFFQLPGLSEWYVRRADFAYVDSLWQSWSPGWSPPHDHLAAVKRTLAASWPSPILHYRSGGFGGGTDWRPIATPTLYLVGARDGCVLPEIAAGQERYFAGSFESEVIPGVGHFLHLEQPEVVGQKVMAWLAYAVA
jgi:pimeloyl-ACP methyl ester carboxylesterase